MQTENLIAFKKWIKNKKIAVVGLGRSNLPLIQFLLTYTSDITGFDKSREEQLSDIIPDLKQQGVRFSLGEDYLDSLVDYDIIFRTPGMRPDHPVFVQALKKGAALTSEMEVFFALCPAKIYGITGSDGKTTTSTLIFEMLKAQGYICYLGGNIGKPLIGDLKKIQASDMVVVELSSFQLMTLQKSPEIAVITNITPNHLDVHLSMSEYVEAKKNLYRYQKPADSVILNADNPLTRGFYGETHGKAVLFSRQQRIASGFFMDEKNICYQSETGTIHPYFSAENIRLPGLHNLENYMAAMAAVRDFVTPETMLQVAKNFGGVEHRIEWVREFKGVRYYNDSIASSPSRTIAGLRSFGQRVLLMAGGCDKKLDYSEFGEILLDTVKDLVLVGQTGPKIAEALRNAQIRTGRGQQIGVHLMDSFEAGVEKIASLAEPGDIVILSPASTSFDRFKNFEERGQYFKSLVLAMEPKDQ